MSLKRPRIHLSGISNNDFRTKGETKNIKRFQPYHESKNFGMQGLGNYKLPFSIHKELFKPTIGLNEGKYVENDIQNPKIYDTAFFYHNNSMKIKPRSLLIGERSKQLDTSEYRGGLEYNGDSMMIADTIKKRKEIKIKEKLIQENLKKKHIGVISGGIMENHDFIKNNNKSENENNENKNTNDNINIIGKEKKLCKSNSDGLFLDKKVSKERLNMIRNKIYDRLKTHTNTKEIFLNWQKNYLNNRELSMFDLHKIINDLGIPISYNEVFALISSSNKRNTDKLNYDEFKDLLLNSDKNIDSDLSKLPYRNENIYIENNIKEEENKKQLLNNLKISQNENYFALQKIIRSRHPNFIQSMKIIQNEKEPDNNNNIKGLCDLPTFKQVLDTIKIPEKYKNDSIINTIYNQYKVPDKNLMDYEKFIENCKNIKETNDFFIFQNGYLGLIQQKLEKNEEERKKYNDILVENQKRKKSHLTNLGNQFNIDNINDMPYFNKRLHKNKSNSDIYINRSIDREINKNKKYSLEKDDNFNNINEDNMKTINLNENNTKNDNKKESENNENKIITNNKIDFYNHYQPSLNFINYVFKDNKLYNDRYYKAIDEISPLIPKKTNDQNELIKKNFSEMDEKKYQMLLNSRKFNKNFLSCEIGMPGYIEEQERYKRYELSEGEKKRKLKYMENTLKRKADTNKEWNDRINFQQNVVDINNSLGQIKRTENLYRYEKRIYNMNIVT